MNPASAFLVRARATWPGTCISTTVGCRETGGGARSRTQAVGLLHLLPPSPIPCPVMSAGPLLETHKYWGWCPIKVKSCCIEFFIVDTEQQRSNQGIWIFLFEDTIMPCQFSIKTTDRIDLKRELLKRECILCGYLLLT